MDEFKKLILPLLAVIAAITGIGLLSQKKEVLNLRVPTTPVAYASVEIKIGGSKVQAKIADTEAKRKIGLSRTASLAENEGMLFVFDQKDVQTPFWMKDMQMAIDIIWINDDQVVKIDKNALPPAANTPEEKLKLYPAPGPIDYVLEVASGFSEKNNLKVGSPINLPNL